MIGFERIVFMKEHINECILVSVDFDENGKSVLTVGRQRYGKVDVINAFEGQEAKDLYDRLITKKEEDDFSKYMNKPE